MGAVKFVLVSIFIAAIIGTIGFCAGYLYAKYNQTKSGGINNLDRRLADEYRSRSDTLAGRIDSAKSEIDRGFGGVEASLDGLGRIEGNQRKIIELVRLCKQALGGLRDGYHILADDDSDKYRRGDPIGASVRL